jgi:outer membrane immunogenic protein
MKRVLLASVGLMILAGSASAADLGPRYRPVVPKAPVMAPYYNWTGFYLGINGGGAWGSSEWSGIPGSFDTSGGLIGGTIGYNWQTGPVVFGLEGDADWASIDGSTTGGNCAGLACKTESNFLATVSGRLGYAFDRVMPYVTGGLAIGNIKATYPGFPEVDDTNTGWTAGGGIEFAFAGNWTAKVEYLHVDLGDISCGPGTSCAFPGVGNTVDLTEEVVRGGINYRF